MHTGSQDFRLCAKNSKYICKKKKKSELDLDCT